MNKPSRSSWITVIVTHLFLLTSGCSGPAINENGASGESAIPISDQRAGVSDFKKQGIKIYYSFFGSIKAIEASGDAPVWGNSPNAIRDAYRVAELEAKKSLNDFINKETLTSTVSQRMISRNLERAEDRSGPPGDPRIISSTDEEVTSTDGGSTSTRQNALDIASTLSTTIHLQARGILGGLYLVEGHPSEDGRRVLVTYRWDKEHTEARLQVRGLMMQ
jgi:hypothetical protein